ncbi:uncharacterized protein [Salminus brasiliensis]|uniref:uncharacterized protein n=1 Tax=Salminus brasiliensis TaxID=930266 RepID=UPI003B82DC59
MRGVDAHCARRSKTFPVQRSPQERRTRMLQISAPLAKISETLRGAVTECSASMSAPPAPPAPPAAVSASPAQSESCWSCRLLSGSALLFSAGFVLQAARRTGRQGGSGSVGAAAQILFAAGLAAWGLVVITDPVGKSTKKTRIL